MQRASRRAGGARLLVLLYHCFFDEFGEGDWRVGAADYMTTFARFARDLDWLRTQDVAFRTPDDFFAPGAAGADLSVFITFDDGYRAILPALERLQREGIAAGVFVNSGLVESGRLAWPEELLCCFAALDARALAAALGARRWQVAAGALFAERVRVFRDLRAHLKTVATDEREAFLAALYGRLGFRGGREDARSLYDQLALLSWRDLAGLAARGVLVGGHTGTHPVLSRSSSARARAEIVTDRDRLRQQVGQEPVLFAIPNGQPGDYTAAHVDLCRRAGYRFVFSTEPGVNTRDDGTRVLRRVDVGHEGVDIRAVVRAAAR